MVQMLYFGIIEDVHIETWGSKLMNNLSYELSMKDFDKSISLDPTNMLYYENRA
jgi:hypothetical protein